MLYYYIWGSRYFLYSTGREFWTVRQLPRNSQLRTFWNFWNRKLPMFWLRADTGRNVRPEVSVPGNQGFEMLSSYRCWRSRPSIRPFSCIWNRIKLLYNFEFNLMGLCPRLLGLIINFLFFCILSDILLWKVVIYKALYFIILKCTILLAAWAQHQTPLESLAGTLLARISHRQLIDKLYAFLTAFLQLR